MERANNFQTVSTPGSNFTTQIKVEPGTPPSGLDPDEAESFLDSNGVLNYRFQQIKPEPGSQLPAMVIKEEKAPLEAELKPSTPSKNPIVRQFVDKLVAELDGMGVPESRKRDWVTAFKKEAAEKLNSVQATNTRPLGSRASVPVEDAAGSGLSDSVQFPELPIAPTASSLATKLSSSSATVSSAVVSPKASLQTKSSGRNANVEPKRKKKKLSTGTPNSNWIPIATISPAIKVEPGIKLTSYSVRFFECPSCCKEFDLKEAAVQHLRTCTDPFNFNATNMGYLK